MASNDKSTKTIQQLMLSSGELRTWAVDEEAIAQTIPWASRKPELLRQELEEMGSYFPIFITTIAGSSGDLITCPHCSGKIIFRDGLRCSECEVRCKNPPREVLLSFCGELRTELLIVGEQVGEDKIKGRPCLREIYKKLGSMGNAERERFLELIGEYFVNIDGKIFFTPYVQANLSSSWPSSQPTVYLKDSYFKVLSTSHEHVYPASATSGLQSLCIYSSWPRTTLKTVLQQRIVPRVLIDFMIADLRAEGKLSEALKMVGTSEHGVYNVIGTPEGERLKRAYERFVDEVTFRI